MTRKWIEDIGAQYDATLESRRRENPSEREVIVEKAFQRVRAEIREAADELTARFGNRFVVADSNEGQTIVVRALISNDRNQAARFDFNTHDATIHAHPASGFAFVRSEDRHTFTFDSHSGSFEQNGAAVSDEELVARAMQPFLKANLGL